ncbi:MAG: iron-sulfur cluster-binding protein [Planctomycetes bacterium]|nr:iron-sulfur cluster-binding protein [Planctomycetota bacterium]
MSVSEAFRRRIAEAVADERVVQAVHDATWRKVEARSAAIGSLHDPEAIRTLAGQIKQHTLENLPAYLAQFVTQVRQRGGVVHFAADAAAARATICAIAAARGLKLAVKSKSMTTEEVDLNRALEAAGVRVVETDLGEYIVQIDHDRPSHIVTPIIHKNRRQIARAMQRELGCPYTEDANELTRLAREHLREIFRRCDLGISGVNFGIAETGTICLVTNEGNGRMTVTRPRVHIALMGIEKVIPRLRDMAVYLKLLARSSTGQPMGSYTTLVTGPKRAADVDGPEELHVVLMDNGRSDILAGPFAEVLRCVRCGACLNVCPVYRNIGGHAYASVYPGPIGSLVTPLLEGLVEHTDLPRASTLCGLCEKACPVKIDIPALLQSLRAAARDTQPLSKRAGLRLWRWAMESAAVYGFGQRFLRGFLWDTGGGWARSRLGPLGAWTACRDLPLPAERSFRRLWHQELRDER